MIIIKLIHGASYKKYSYFYLKNEKFWYEFKLVENQTNIKKKIMSLESSITFWIQTKSFFDFEFKAKCIFFDYEINEI